MCVLKLWQVPASLSTRQPPRVGRPSKRARTLAALHARWPDRFPAPDDCPFCLQSGSDAECEVAYFLTVAALSDEQGPEAH